MDLPGSVPEERGGLHGYPAHETTMETVAEDIETLPSECECRICLEPGRPMQWPGDSKDGDSCSSSAGDGPDEQAGDGRPDADALVSPCTCSGSLRWAHWGCLEKWVAERNSLTCEICGHPYKERIEKLLISRVRMAESNTLPSTGWRIIQEQAENGRETTLILVGYLNASNRGASVPMIHEALVLEQQREAAEAATELEAYRTRFRRRKLRIFWMRNAVLLLLTICVLLLLVYFGRRTEDSKPSLWILLLLRLMSFMLPMYLISQIAERLRANRRLSSLPT